MESIILGSELTGDRRYECDVCIVGSGPGGAVAAKELSAKGRNVILIEEGPISKKPGEICPDEVLMKYYRDSGMVSTYWPSVFPIPTGRVFGGTSVINSGTCFPTPDFILKWWQKAVGVSFDVAAWREAEREIEREISIRPCPEEMMGISCKLFAEGLKKLNLPGGAPLSRCENGCVGSGLCCFICPKEAKQAVNLNYLKTAMQNGIRCFVETEARRLICDRTQARELICETKAEGRVRVKAKNFVLAMGAIRTPQFLIENGLRRTYHAIGKNLSIHPAMKVFALMSKSVKAWEGVPQAYGYTNPDHPNVHFEGVFIPPFMAAISIPFLGEDLIEWMQYYDRLVGMGFFIADGSYGTLDSVRRVGPVIRYGLTPQDIDGFHYAMKLIAQTYFEVGAVKVLLPIIDAHNTFNSFAEVEQGFRREKLKSDHLLGMGFHPLGTCRFSNGPENGVIDSHGKLHKHKNVFICDGSAIPGPLHVNPQVTIMAFAKHVVRSL